MKQNLLALTLLIMALSSCNGQGNTKKLKNDSIILKVNIINSLPVGWGVRYKAIIEKVVDGSAQDMKDTIEFGITASGVYKYLNIGDKHLMTFYNSGKINNVTYLPAINGTVSKTNEIWLITKIDSVAKINERRIFTGKAIISDGKPMFVWEFAHSEAFYLDGLKSWDNNYLNKTITVEGILTQYIDGVYSGSVIKDWKITECK